MGQVRCERRIEVFVKIKKNLHFIWGGGEGGGRGGVGLGVVRMDVYEELKFLGNFTQKSRRGGGGGSGGGSGWWGGSERRIEVFLKFKNVWGSGQGGRVGGNQGKCEQRSVVFVKIQKKLYIYIYIFFFFFFGGGGGGSGRGGGFRGRGVGRGGSR